jgi:hypothetical protein
MTRAQITAALQQQPFPPFSMILANGEHIPVGPDGLKFPDEQSVEFVTKLGVRRLIDLHYVMELSFLPWPRTRRLRNSRKWPWSIVSKYFRGSTSTT